jgi:hypothetical protein
MLVKFACPEFAVVVSMTVIRRSRRDPVDQLPDPARYGDE